MAFEGSEKKFELVLELSAASLLELPRSFWDEIITASGATVLEQRKSETCSSFLLAESSLFVFSHRVVMITCGQTRLIDGLLRLLKSLERSNILGLFYERKNELFPELQASSFESDVGVLEQELEGSSLLLGAEDHLHVSLFSTNVPFPSTDFDTTTEVLMHGLRKEVSGELSSDIISFFENFETHDYHFSPRGYSINGFYGQSYFTSHITPETDGSYASFETNLELSPERTLGLLSLLSTEFEPEAFALVSFHPEFSVKGIPEGYSLERNESHLLANGYPVNYFQFSRMS